MLEIIKYIKPISLYLLFYYITFIGYASLHFHPYHLATESIIESQRDTHDNHNFLFLDGDSKCRIVKFINTNYSNDSTTVHDLFSYLLESSIQPVETSSKQNLLEKQNLQLRAPPTISFS